MNVAQVLYKVGARLPGSWYTGLASADGADETEVVDVSAGGSDDVWNFGTIIIIKTPDDLAPMYEGSVVQDYVASTGTWTVDPQFTAIVELGDRFGAIKPRYRKELLLQKMNEALADIKLYREDVSLVGISNVKSYPLPTGWTEENLLQVHIAVRDSAPYEYKPVYNWWVEYDDYTTPGTPVSVIRFDAYPVAGRKILLKGYTTPPDAWEFSDVLDERLDEDMVVAMTHRRVLEWRYSKFSVPPDRETNALNASLRREAAAIRAGMPKLPKRMPKFNPVSPMGPGDRVAYPSRD